MVMKSTIAARRNRARHGIRRVLADAVGAFAVFTFLLGAVSWSDGSAAGSPRPGDVLALTATAEPAPRTVSNSGGALSLAARPGSASEETVFRRTPYTPTLLTLAAVFSLLAAGNLAFLRHLRRVSATARRGGTTTNPAAKGWT